ncbi:serine dehydratase subunit alpha family protein [Acidaminococcus timonensis]|uniref:L-cysteine desulfidase family protein n=1 Tax=Acidaminococcus timonensis TaxID=1871002 RepID=UPI003C6CE44F
MTLSAAIMDNYSQILQEELIPAMGCTEPIAIAYAAAKAKSYLPEEVVRYEVDCSGNMIKNVRGVTVPNSNGQKGIPAAAALGICGGDPSKVLEVIAGVTDAQREACRELVARNVCDVELVEGVPGLYIDVKIWGEKHSSEVILSGNHTNVYKIVQDGNVLYDQSLEAKEGKHKGTDWNLMSLEGILKYASTVDLEKVRDVLETEIKDNAAISQEGLDHPWGTQVGRTIRETIGDSVMARAEAAAAAGSDARMSGCPKPVVINAGSGNQGITVTMPILVYAKEWGLSHDETLRALIVGDLISVYIKHYIGPLSAFCGSVNAACGAGAAITWMATRDYQHVADTITNTLCNVGGMVCDGAKPSCAAKIAAAVHAALMGHYMSMHGQVFKEGEGLVGKNIEETIKNIGYLGKVGMKQTDIEILKTMIGKVDVDAALQ